jgi:hypothetical protein
MFRLLTTLALAVGSLLAAGCATTAREDSTIPWSRPASWEGGIPGVGIPNAGGR